MTVIIARPDIKRGLTEVVADDLLMLEDGAGPNMPVEKLRVLPGGDAPPQIVFGTAGDGGHGRKLERAVADWVRVFPLSLAFHADLTKHLAQLESMLDVVSEGVEDENSAELLLVVGAQVVVYHPSFGLTTKTFGTPAAIGWGAGYALGAMEMGADALRAYQVAKQFCVLGDAIFAWVNWPKPQET